MKQLATIHWKNNPIKSVSEQENAHLPPKGYKLSLSAYFTRKLDNQNSRIVQLSFQVPAMHRHLP